MKRADLATFVGGLVMLALVLAIYATRAHANMLGSVGVLMSPTNGNNPPSPMPSNAITTEAGLALTTEAGATLTTEAP